MKRLTSLFSISFLGALVFTSLVGFHAEPPALATVTKSGKGFKYSNINHAIVKKNISNGFKVVKVGIHYLDNTFFLVRKVQGPKGKIGHLYSEVKRVGNKLYPIKHVELYFACWQIASCQCERPSRYADCSCGGAGGSDGCTTELGPALWDAYYVVTWDDNGGGGWRW